MRGNDKTGAPSIGKKANNRALSEYLLSAPLVQWAEAGDRIPLIQHLESGGDFTPQIRDVVIRLLRDEIPKRRGVKRLAAQADRESEIGMAVWMIKKFRKVTTYRAIQIYCEQHPDQNPETVRTIVRRRKI